MGLTKLPFIRMPKEFVYLLKANMGVTPQPSEVMKVLRSNPSLVMVMEKAFSEFDDGRGIEKVMAALGWQSFKERLSSLYVSKALYGKYSHTTDLEIIADITKFESRYHEFEVSSFSRLYLLGLYLKFANIKLESVNDKEGINISPAVFEILRVIEGRAERIDWLILIISHLLLSFDVKLIINHLGAHKKIDDFYEMMSPTDRKLMFDNLLSYGASIGEQDFVLYAKI